MFIYIYNINNGVQNTNNIVQLGPHKDPGEIVRMYLTDSHMMEGIAGLAKCIAEHNQNIDGTYNFAIADQSRKILRYNDSENKMIKDKGASEFAKMVEAPVREKTVAAKNEVLKKMDPEDSFTCQLYQRVISNCFCPLMDITKPENESKFALELSKILPK